MRTKEQGFGRNPSEGEAWEPGESEDTKGLKKGDRVKINPRFPGDSGGFEGEVVGFSKKFGTKQIKVVLGSMPEKISIFELDSAEKI